MGPAATLPPQEHRRADPGSPELPADHQDQDGRLPSVPVPPHPHTVGGALRAPAQVPALLRQPELVQKAVPRHHPRGRRSPGWVGSKAGAGHELGPSTPPPQAYPEMGTVEGLASVLLDMLPTSSWADRVHMLHALLTLLPDLGHGLRSQLRDLLLHLLNLDQPPSFQDPTQKQFVMLALQLLLACFLESNDTVLELMSYFLYSPDPCRCVLPPPPPPALPGPCRTTCPCPRPELKKLMDRLGLQDPQGFLFKEMLTWVQGAQLSSKSTLRTLCCQKLEGMIQQLQVLLTPLPGSSRTWGQSWGGGTGTARPGHPSGSPWAAASLRWGGAGRGGLEAGRRGQGVRGGAPIPAALSASRFLQIRITKAQAASPEPSALPTPPKEAPLKAAPPVSPVPWRHLLEPPLPAGAGAGAELQAQPVRSRWTKRALSETLQNFCGTPRPSWRSPASPALPERPQLPHGQMLDLGCIDALNYFCEQQRAQQLILLWEEAQRLRSPEPNTVVRPPHDRRRCPILRLQEAEVHSSEERPRGECAGRRRDRHPHPHACRHPHRPAPAPAGRMPPALRTGRTRPLDGSIRALKLPLPRVEVQPFPAGWPQPARPRCPLPLQPGLQRYFVPGRADPDGLG
uniref:Uncharacterized protein n=1 Tax=Oryctolagus cuniculus TaxID=9986 RepID=G1SKN1_RABIT